MRPTLSVRLSGKEILGVDPPERVVAGRPFDLVFRNEGRSTHVHSAPDDDLVGVLELPEDNVFVEGESVTRVTVSVAADAAGTDGALKIVAGYGAAEIAVDLSIVAPDADEERVEADPRPTGDPGAGLDEVLAHPAVPLVGLGLLALGLAGLVVLTVGEPVIWLGALAVLAGVAAALAIVYGRAEDGEGA